MSLKLTLKNQLGSKVIEGGGSPAYGLESKRPKFAYHCNLENHWQTLSQWTINESNSSLNQPFRENDKC